MFAYSFAALGLWLTIRVINRRERWAKRMLLCVILGSPALYLLALGPAVYLGERGLISQTELQLLAFPYNLWLNLYGAYLERWADLAGPPQRQ